MASSLSLAEENVVQFFDDLVRCETRLYNALNDRLRELHGVVTSQLEFLRYLQRHPDCRIADLAGYFAVGIGATSKGIDRLEARGWVQRLPNPHDRRSSLLSLTAEGQQFLDSAERTFVDQTHELITSVLSATQLTAAADALSVLRSALQNGQIGVPIG
ncbi:MarR family winged helix-turn-helix transcriptional regulator [Psychromicrobium sp. YIM B11713]|uniref:MarR family winged helix-turn-helix transcriptional regulator n=1 Tax=Psychromicrobium sp. YIM B11713 TaxID=3145233 RepID=UPI00374E719A